MRRHLRGVAGQFGIRYTIVPTVAVKILIYARIGVVSPFYPILYLLHGSTAVYCTNRRMVCSNRELAHQRQSLDRYLIPPERSDAVEPNRPGSDWRSTWIDRCRHTDCSSQSI